MIMLLLFSFLAGLVTVLSPCILPILPVLLAAGIGVGRYRSLGIVIGLVASFTFFTLTLTTIVQATGISPDILRYLALILISCAGLIMIFPTLELRFAHMTSWIARLGTTVQEQAPRGGSGFGGGLVVGISLGLIWTPCAGPILAAITTLVATHALNLHAVLVTLAYSLGAAVPMFFISYGGTTVINGIMGAGRYTDLIRKLFGILMILGALAIAFHMDVFLQQITLKYFPTLSVESSQAAEKALSTLRPNP